MNNSKIYLPKTIKVGYQKRDDCYTGRLAYVIYTDDKGVLRKEKSWESWRSKSITPDDYPNEPLEGFVLNRKVGGTQNYYYDYRQTYVRVYDPRGFEFEITIPNLLYILMNCSAVKGKGLEGKFVYGWSGTELLLIPCDAPEYQEMINYTKLQAMKLKKAEMVPGMVYQTKDEKMVTYLGFYPYLSQETSYSRIHNMYIPKISKAKKHWFWRHNHWSKDAQYAIDSKTSLDHIAQLASEEPDPLFAERFLAMQQHEDFKNPIGFEFQDPDYAQLKKENNYHIPVYLQKNDKLYLLQFDRAYNHSYYGQPPAETQYELVYVAEMKTPGTILQSSYQTKYDYSNKEKRNWDYETGIRVGNRYTLHQLEQLNLKSYNPIFENNGQQK